ncbi:MAG: hypothetical protein AB4352_03985 [Hormoscilla sp.]
MTCITSDLVRSPVRVSWYQTTARSVPVEIVLTGITALMAPTVHRWSLAGAIAGAG